MPLGVSYDSRNCHCNIQRILKQNDGCGIRSNIAAYINLPIYSPTINRRQKFQCTRYIYSNQRKRHFHRVSVVPFCSRSSSDKLPTQVPPVSSPLVNSEPALFALAAAVGLGTGTAVTLFKLAINAVKQYMYGDAVAGVLLPSLHEYNVIVIPLIGGLAVGVLKQGFGPLPGGLVQSLSELESGVRAKIIGPTAKATAAVFTLGTGCSLGPEGPSVELGASVARLVGQFSKVSVEKQRLLVAAGAAAGVAAGFDAPIAGVFFAQEIVLSSRSSWLSSRNDSLGSSSASTQVITVLLLASSVSALVSQAGLGANPAFQLPLYELRNPALELPLYIGLGLLVGGASIAFKSVLDLGRRLFGEAPGLRKVPAFFKPAIGGVACGIVAVYYPQILFFGYDTLDALLADVQFPLGLLLTLLLLKPVMTAISLGSGLIGGTFAPTMFLGATLGASYNKLLETGYENAASILYKNAGPDMTSAVIESFSIAGPPAYSIVGMAAALAAGFRAPLTAFLLMFELTRDYRIILPLMASVGFSSWLVERVEARTPAVATSVPPARETSSRSDDKTSVSESSALEYGVRVDAETDAELQQIPVKEGIVKDVLRVVERDSVAVALDRMTQRKQRFALIFTNSSSMLPKAAQRLCGIITLHDIDLLSGSQDESVKEMSCADAGSRRVLCLRSDSNLKEAYETLRNSGLRQLPVLDSSTTNQKSGTYSSTVCPVGIDGRVLGTVDVESIKTAYRLALTRRALSSAESTSSSTLVKPRKEPTKT